MYKRRSATDLERSFFNGRIETWLSDDRDVEVEADYDAPDASVGLFADGATVCRVYCEGKDITDEVQPEEIEELESRVLEKFYDYCEAYYEGDG